MTNVRLSESAQEHIDQAVSWLQAEAPEQVDRFLRYLADTTARIAAFPRLGHPTEDAMRRMPMRVFQYQLWYILEEHGAVVVAVTHPRQDASAVLHKPGPETSEPNS